MLGAKELPASAVPNRSWCLDAALRERAGFSTAWLSTEGLTVSYVVGRAPPIACDGVVVKGRWVRCGFATARSLEPRRIERAGGGLTFCFRPGPKPRYRPFMWIAVPAETHWALVDHYRYWTAYRSAGRRLLRISGVRRAPEFRVEVAFLDRRGHVRSEREIRGYVAG